MVDKKSQGKKNRRKGGEFELLVRKDLESKGWIVSKWMNNIELTGVDFRFEKDKPELLGKLIPAKRKYNPFNKALSVGTGFPDFIAFAPDQIQINISGNKTYGISPRTELKNRIINGEQFYRIIAVEAKSNGRLDREEREKCKWLLENNVFSKILIARLDYPEENINLPPEKRKKKEIIYEEFKQERKA